MIAHEVYGAGPGGKASVLMPWPLACAAHSDGTGWAGRGEGRWAGTEEGRAQGRPGGEGMARVRGVVPPAKKAARPRESGPDLPKSLR